jgi:hypothetical protein
MRRDWGIVIRNVTKTNIACFATPLCPSPHYPISPSSTWLPLSGAAISLILPTLPTGECFSVFPTVSGAGRTKTTILSGHTLLENNENHGGKPGVNYFWLTGIAPAGCGKNRPPIDTTGPSLGQFLIYLCVSVHFRDHDPLSRRWWGPAVRAVFSILGGFGIHASSFAPRPSSSLPTY